MQFYATTFLFTLAGIIFVILAIAGVVVLPLILKFVGRPGNDGRNGFLLSCDGRSFL